MKYNQLLVAQGIIKKNGKILLGLRNSPNDPAHGLWQLCGGKVEFAENPVAAVIREIREETGYKVKVLSEKPIISNVLWKRKRSRSHIVLLGFECKIHSGKLLIGGRENSDWKWITKADYKKLKLKYTPGTAQALKVYFS